MNLNEINSLYPENQLEKYDLIKKQLSAILEGEHNVIANLSNSSALLNEALTDINWVGFYLMNKGELLLGPFQGKVACVHIALGRGVCGTAAKDNQTQLVKNVHEFPGHIACDSASNSEVVVPLRHNGEVVGVLDIDSPLLERFNEIDARELEEIAKIIEESCDWA
jgi:GAF domain-containing protein